jgi:hypothetical protein
LFFPNKSAYLAGNILYLETQFFVIHFLVV